MQIIIDIDNSLLDTLQYNQQKGLVITDLTDYIGANDFKMLSPQVRAIVIAKLEVLSLAMENIKC